MAAAPSSQCQRDCLVAIGVLTVPDNTVRRRHARSTWFEALRHTSRFLIRSRGLPKVTRARLEQEQTEHGDMLFLPVDAHQHRQKGRIFAFHAWLRLSIVVCPACVWVCKADDDVFIENSDLERALQLMGNRGLGRVPTLAGSFFWHTWNTRWFMHHTFFHDYGRRALEEARRAINFFGSRGDSVHSTGVVGNTALQRALRRCTPGGPLTGCGWCNRADECSGPFPFAVGWLFVMSAPLAVRLRQSRLMTAELGRLASLNRSWGPPALEDIWLGSMVHRLSCGDGLAVDRPAAADESDPITLVNLAPSYYFNGGWHTGKGMEFNTTWLYHNKHELPLIKEHVRATHRASRPVLQCSGEGPNGRGARRKRRRASRSAEDLPPPPLPYATAQERSFRLYLRDASCTKRQTTTPLDEPQWCTLVEEEHLVRPALRQLDQSKRINRVARDLTASERAIIKQYHEEVRTARRSFREELRQEAFDGGELGVSDYLDV